MLKNLKLLREEAGMSQKALAEKIGVSQQSINKYENHSIEPDIDTMIRIADCFDTSVDYLIGHTSIRQKIEPVCTIALNKEEQSLIETFRTLSAPQKKTVRLVATSYHTERHPF